MNIEINKNINISIYKQIIEQITSMINQGTLKAGEQLLPERELANRLNISRGTITKAYQELEKNNIINVIRGSGSFISERQDVLVKGRKERAIEIIENTLNDLESLKFTQQEIKIFLDIMLMEREKRTDKIHIATVDCNPEALAIFKRQLSYISNVKITRFLLDDIVKIPNFQKTFDTYNLVISTSTHYEELSQLIPKQKDSIIKAAVSPSQQTIIDIAKIPQNSRIGILCFTERFYNIIISTLGTFDVNELHIEYMLQKGNIILNINKFLFDKKILVIPSDSILEQKYQLAIKDFTDRGGLVIRFEYQIQRGTLIYIEECISDLLRNS